MSIRSLATELYKAQQKVHRLQDKLESAELKDKDLLRAELRRAEAACAQLRRIMEGEKQGSPFSKKSFR